MEIINVTKENFEEEVLNSKVIVLADFNADWCGPCKMIKPMLEEISKESDEYKIVSINIDNDDELSEEYNVSSIPCLVVFNDGKEINRSVGLKPIDEIRNLLKIK